jgi:DNA adenine methylase
MSSRGTRARRPAPRNEAVRPILKWAGGKRQLLPALRPFYPTVFESYAEPFLGSGAVFLDCYNAGLLEGRPVRLSDNNADIIGCYRMVRDAVEETIAALRELEQGHRAGGPDHFYAVRDGRFNQERTRMQAAADLSTCYTPALAAMLIYLNRTGYNGLFRVNASGAYNVPVGRYVSPTICDADNLRGLARAFSAPGVSLELRPFQTALEEAAPGDFVYLDPPYVPLSATARFTSYTAAGFGAAEQQALQRSVLALAARGVHVLLSNSVAPEVTRLYAGAEARTVGLQARTVPARRAINSRASGRGAVREYVITNVRRSRKSLRYFV